MHVKDGDTVERGQLLFETVEGTLDGLGVYGATVQSDVAGVIATTDPSDPRCYDSSALAITTVFQLKNSGEILDADIEVNGVHFTWGDFVGHPDQISYSTHDFQGAITHELGHVLGLEHTCYIPRYYTDGTPVPRPVDNTGAPIPNCGSENPPAIADATMYVSVSSPETEIGLRTLAADDMQGACEIYPYSPNYVCGTPSSTGTDINPFGGAGGKGGGGCSFGPRPGTASIAGALGLAALALIVRRRRR